MNNAVTQEITINASIQTVWQVVTKPEYVSKWFSDTATYEVRAGSKGALRWKGMGEAPFEVLTVDEPHTFAFSWISPDEETKRAEAKTQVTFQLTEVDGGTRLSVTESGFDQTALTDAEKTEIITKHTSGWSYFLRRIGDNAENFAPKA